MVFRILLADDSLPGLLAVKSMLEQQGCTVTTAEQGDIALALAESHEYDFILLDEYMPGLKGSEVALAINSGSGRNQDTPIIALTGAHSEEELGRLRKAGVQNVVRKPVSKDALLALLSTPLLDAQFDDKADIRGALPIDPQVASALQADLGSASVRLYGLFADELDSLLVRLETSVNNKDRAELLAVTHILKNSAALYGALALADLARDINESDADEPDWQVAVALVRLCSEAGLCVRENYCSEGFSS